jgi:DNA polymerase
VNLSSFINNNKDLSSATSKPTYLAKLFSKSPWLLKLKGQSLDSDFKSSTPKVETSSSVVEPMAIKEEIAAPKPKPVEQVIAPKTEVPSTAMADPVSKLSQYASKEKIVPENLTVKEYSIENNFNTYLTSICSTWSTDSIVGINAFDKELDVLFVGLDEFSLEDLPEATPLSLIESEQDLLGKMIKAMNLREGRFLRLPLLKGEKDLEFILAAVKFFNPKVVVPLGANSTNIILEKRVKLSNVHGQFEKKAFKLNGEDLILNISPLFHPQLLEINQSMKRTAWIDMQKVMKIVGNN